MESNQRIGPYTLLTQLAEGGHGDVWLAVHGGPDGFRRRCALKVLAPGHDDAARKNFTAEARLMTRFEHPNLLAATDFGRDGDLGVLYLAMPYHAGQSLAAVMHRCRQSPYFDVPEVLWIAVRLLDALDFVHELRDERQRPLGVIHRDISPENLLLGYGGHVKLIDFGIALSTLSPRMTHIYSVKGKIGYLAPEQARGERELDFRTDLYQVGLLLYHMLGGDNPLDAPLADALERARNPDFPRIDEVSDVPRRLADTVHACLAAEPQRRPDSARTLARELRDILHHLQPRYDALIFDENIAQLLREDRRRERHFLSNLEAGTQVIGEAGELDASELDAGRGRRGATLVDISDDSEPDTDEFDTGTVEIGEAPSGSSRAPRESTRTDIDISQELAADASRSTDLLVHSPPTQRSGDEITDVLDALEDIYDEDE